MKKILVCLITLLLLISNSFSQNFINKSIETDYPSTRFIYKTIKTNDNGNLILMMDAHFHITLVKLNSYKEIEWSEYIPITDTPFSVVPISIIQDMENNFYLLIKDERVDMQLRTCLLKISNTGELLWERRISTSFSIFSFKDIEILHEGSSDFICTNGRWGTCGDPLVLKIDTDGNIIWANEYVSGGSNSYKSKKLSDNNIIFYSTSFNKVYLRKLNALGEVVWNKSFAVSPVDYSYYSTGLIETSDKKLITLVNTFDGAGIQYFMLLETDSLGQLVKGCKYFINQNCNANSIDLYNDSTIVIAGQYDTENDFYDSNMFLTFIDINTFNINHTIDTYDPTFSGEANDDFSYVECIGNKILSIGSGGGGVKMFLSVTDSSGNSFCNKNSIHLIKQSSTIVADTVDFTYFPINVSISQDSVFSLEPLTWNETINCETGIEETNNSVNISLYPNPATTTLTIETTLVNSGTIQTDIKNSLGQIVYTLNEKANTGLYKKTIDLNFGQGIYFLTLQTNQGLMTKRIEVIK